MHRRWPASRTIEILQEAGASVIVTDSPAEQAAALTTALEGRGAASVVVVVNEKCEVVQEFSPSEVALPAEKLRSACAEVKAGWAAAAPTLLPEVMYIMYTSGSTGKPKGCVVPTTGVCHRFGWGTPLLGFTSSDVFVLKTPATFDCSIPEMWVPLTLGATSVVVPDGAHLDFDVVKQTIANGGVTVAHFVPSVLALFLDFVSPGDLPTLRQISCTGEALLLSHRDKLTRRLGRPLSLFNLYGPTEAAIEVTYFEATEDVAGLTHGFPIGFAGDAGVRMYVTDANDPTKLMPPGEKGEVCIGGCQVAYGYLGRPELNKEKFVPNPHGDAEGLLYRTGDLGSVDAAGCFSYNGRADRQVKVGGVRMELGEIEAVCLRRFGHLLLNVAVEKVGDRLVGVAAPRHGAMVPPTNELRAGLAAELPSSYIPSEWHIRDALPLGSAGKVDHNKVVSWIADQSKAAVWGSIYDELYFADQFQVDDGVNDPTMDWAAYTDSFTGAMHERPTIEEWVQETVVEVATYEPAHVVEMGCGKGMILFKLGMLPTTRSYVGCDLSRLAIGHVDRVWAKLLSERIAAQNGEGNAYPVRPATPPDACSLSTYVRDASNFAGLADGAYDAFLCNGVSMYFPSAAYLKEVLCNGLPKIKQNGGKLHFGDVISLEHIELFLLRKARHAGTSFEQLQEPEQRQQLIAQAKDRVFSFLLFYALLLNGALPGVAAVEIQLKHGAIMSEFSRYRYNVVLHLGAQPAAPPLVAALPSPPADDATADQLAAALRALAAKKF